ncbi:PPE family protein [Mycobacterium marinum]|uniref:PPE family protein n=1 Tax=Mycobacterium marinum TaxID=1781 RepID=UPI003565F540
MVLSFETLPPEVTSARMYAGPGSESFRTAAVAWSELSAELDSAAEVYRSVVCELTSSHWLGTSAASMAAAMVPQHRWLASTAEQSRQTATQATAAAIAYEQAFAMTVPPAAIAANRTLLRSLVATNFIGQNNAAIASTEAQYAAMWVENATAMYDYAAAAAAAIQLTPFTSPYRLLNPTGALSQTTAVARAAAEVAESGGNWVGNLLIIVGTIVTFFIPGNPVGLFLIMLGGVVNMVWLPTLFPDGFSAIDAALLVYATVSVTNNVNSLVTGMIGAEKDLGVLPNLGPAAEDQAPKAEGHEPPNAPGLLLPLQAIGDTVSAEGLGEAGGLGKVSAAARSAGSIRQMSVPPAWSAPAPATVAKTFEATPAPMTALSAEESGAAAAPGMPGMPAPGAGRSSAGPRYGMRLIVMSRPLCGG